MKPLFKLVFCAAAMLLLLVSESWSQISGGSIVGSVLDSSGAVIAGARVTATNVCLLYTSELPTILRV